MTRTAVILSWIYSYIVLTYIFLPKANVCHCYVHDHMVLTLLQGNSDGANLYQHPVVISTLCDLLFSPVESIHTKYPNCFKENEAHALEPAMTMSTNPSDLSCLT